MIRRITFRQLQIFCAVTRLQSFVRASEELHLTQPAVSMQVKQLEDAVGMPLIDRVGKRVALTEAGRHFHDHAARVLGELHDAEETLSQLKGLRGGTVTVGMVSTAKYFVPKLLARFTAQYPDVELRLMTGNRGTLLGYLHRNEIDLAVMGRPPREMQMVAEAFAQHPYVFIAPTDHRLAGATNIDLFDMRDETMLLREPESGTRILNDDYFRKCLFTPRRKIEMGSNETIKQAVMAAMGLALLSQHTLGLELKHRAIAILDVADTPIMRTWHIAHQTEKRHSPVAKAMRDFVLEHGGDFLRSEFAPVREKPAKPRGSVSAERRPRKRARPAGLA
ncbi:MAG: LysR substrate-binding domain-containing protein [Dokdonella sp.]|uniref:LysR family transcriptional regulator n=1 Tax=Dokdonella sp. TaxID=2291710 RepID=UPI003265565C